MKKICAETKIIKRSELRMDRIQQPTSDVMNTTGLAAETMPKHVFFSLAHYFSNPSNRVGPSYIAL